MFSPAGQALLQGGRRSRYTGRAERHVPVRLASEVPAFSVIANGLLGISLTLLIQQAVLADVAVGYGLQARNHFRMRVLAEQVCEASLRLEVFLYRNLAPDFQYAGHFAVLGLEYREHAGLFGQPRHADGVGRGRSPAQRAGHENLDVACAAY